MQGHITNKASQPVFTYKNRLFFKRRRTRLTNKEITLLCHQVLTISLSESPCHAVNVGLLIYNCDKLWGFCLPDVAVCIQQPIKPAFPVLQLHLSACTRWSVTQCKPVWVYEWIECSHYWMLFIHLPEIPIMGQQLVLSEFLITFRMKKSYQEFRWCEINY